MNSFNRQACGKLEAKTNKSIRLLFPQFLRLPTEARNYYSENNALTQTLTMTFV